MEIARHWRVRDERNRLEGEVCSCCNEKIFPKKAVCPTCGERTFNKDYFIKVGQIVALKEVDLALGGQEQISKRLALIRLNEGQVIETTLKGENTFQHGMQVEIKFSRIKVFVGQNGNGRNKDAYRYLHEVRPLPNGNGHKG